MAAAAAVPYDVNISVIPTLTRTAVFTSSLSILATIDAMHDFNDKDRTGGDHIYKSTIEKLNIKDTRKIPSIVLGTPGSVIPPEGQDSEIYAFKNLFGKVMPDHTKTTITELKDFQTTFTTDENRINEFTLHTDIDDKPINYKTKSICIRRDKKWQITPEAFYDWLDVNEQLDITFGIDSLDAPIHKLLNLKTAEVNPAIFKDGIGRIEEIPAIKTISYLKTREEFIDSAPKVTLDSTLKIKIIEDKSKNIITYPATTTTDNQTPSNQGFYSKYTFNIFPIETVGNISNCGMEIVDANIRNPIDIVKGTKEDAHKNSVGKLAAQIRNIINKLGEFFSGKKDEDKHKIKPDNQAALHSYFQRKRAGDWLQVLSCLTPERYGLKSHVRPFLLTVDRICLAYGITMGVDMLYASCRKNGDASENWLTFFYRDVKTQSKIEVLEKRINNTKSYIHSVYETINPNSRADIPVDVNGNSYFNIINVYNNAHMAKLVALNTQANAALTVLRGNLARVSRFSAAVNSIEKQIKNILYIYSKIAIFRSTIPELHKYNGVLFDDYNVINAAAGAYAPILADARAAAGAAGAAGAAAGAAARLGIPIDIDDSTIAGAVAAAAGAVAAAAAGAAGAPAGAAAAAAGAAADADADGAKILSDAISRINQNMAIVHSITLKIREKGSVATPINFNNALQDYYNRKYTINLDTQDGTKAISRDIFKLINDIDLFSDSDDSSYHGSSIFMFLNTNLSTEEKESLFTAIDAVRGVMGTKPPDNYSLFIGLGKLITHRDDAPDIGMFETIPPEILMSTIIVCDRGEPAAAAVVEAPAAAAVVEAPGAAAVVEAPGAAAVVEAPGAALALGRQKTLTRKNAPAAPTVAVAGKKRTWGRVATAEATAEATAMVLDGDRAAEANRNKLIQQSSARRKTLRNDKANVYTTPSKPAMSDSAALAGYTLFGVPHDYDPGDAAGGQAAAAVPMLVDAGAGAGADAGADANVDDKEENPLDASSLTDFYIAHLLLALRAQGELTFRIVEPVQEGGFTIPTSSKTSPIYTHTPYTTFFFLLRELSFRMKFNEGISPDSINVYIILSECVEYCIASAMLKRDVFLKRMEVVFLEYIEKWSEFSSNIYEVEDLFLDFKKSYYGFYNVSNEYKMRLMGTTTNPDKKYMDLLSETLGKSGIKNIMKLQYTKDQEDDSKKNTKILDERIQKNQNLMNIILIIVKKISANSAATQVVIQRATERNTRKKTKNGLATTANLYTKKAHIRNNITPHQEWQYLLNISSGGGRRRTLKKRGRKLTRVHKYKSTRKWRST